jgi:hypothetical protein
MITMSIGDPAIPWKTLLARLSPAEREQRWWQAAALLEAMRGRPFWNSSYDEIARVFYWEDES